MRLSKFLSLSVAMSRNQAKFFIRKGRLSIDGAVVTDPEFELADSSEVVFDGKPISIAGFQYIVLNKPLGFACTPKDAEHPSVLGLLANRSADRFYYFANLLGPDATGLVLLSDDARWTQRIKRRLEKKPRVYRAGLVDSVHEGRLKEVREALGSALDDKSAPVITAATGVDQALEITLRQADMRRVLAVLSSADIEVTSLHLKQLGRFRLGDLGEGESAEVAEDDIKI